MQQRLGASTVLPPSIVDMSFPNLKLPTIPGLAPLPVSAAVSPLTGPPRDRETMLIRRTRELEDELRGTREENEKLVRVSVSKSAVLTATAAIADSQVPRALGEAQRVGEAEAQRACGRGGGPH